MLTMHPQVMGPATQEITVLPKDEGKRMRLIPAVLDTSCHQDPIIYMYVLYGVSALDGACRRRGWPAEVNAVAETNTGEGDGYSIPSLRGPHYHSDKFDRLDVIVLDQVWP